MRTIRTVAEMRGWLGNARAEQRTVALVPTMGAFHAGHHSLMRAARAEQDAVVVSLFVNPAQFNDATDLANYPRSEANDAAEAADLGVHVLVAPRARASCSPRRSARSTPTASAPRSPSPASASCSRAPSAARATSRASAP